MMSNGMPKLSLNRGGSRIFIGEGLQVLGGALLAIEGAPLPLMVTMHYNENYEMLVWL